MMKNRAVSVLLVCICNLWIVSVSLGNPEPFVQHGTQDEQIRISADEILNAIATSRDVDVEYAEIYGDLDIRRVAAQFRQNQDNRPVIEGSIQIHSCHILGSVAFSGASFSANVSFAYSTFESYVDFSLASFLWDASFNSVTFSKSVSFISSSINGNADFDHAVFHGDAVFTSARFSGSAVFNSTAFEGDVIFSGASFGISVHFLRTKMEYPAVFVAVQFKENTVIPGLWNHVFRPTLRLLTIRLWEPPSIMVTDFSEFNTDAAMDSSSNPYLKRYIEDEQWILSWQETTWWRRPAFFIWELTSHCGRSIGLWGFWAGLIAVIYAVIYRWMISESVAFNAERLKDVKPCFRGYLYYSIVTLTTLGFGDIIPLTNRARLVVGTEVGVGYVMLGGLISIFANKLARRS